MSGGRLTISRAVQPASTVQPEFSATTSICSKPGPRNTNGRCSLSPCRRTHREWEIDAQRCPLFIRFRPHDELQNAAGCNLAVPNPCTRQWLSIYVCTLYVRVIRGLILSRDNKFRSLVPLLVQVNCGTGK